MTLMLPPLRPTAPSTGLKPVLQPVRYDAPPEPEPPPKAFASNPALATDRAEAGVPPGPTTAGGGGAGGLARSGFCHTTTPDATFSPKGRSDCESTCMIHSSSAGGGGPTGGFGFGRFGSRSFGSGLSAFAVFAAAAVATFAAAASSSARRDAAASAGDGSLSLSFK